MFGLKKKSLTCISLSGLKTKTFDFASLLLVSSILRGGGAEMLAGCTLSNRQLKHTNFGHVNEGVKNAASLSK